MIPVILLFVGLLLIFLEFFLPGAILGAIGGVFLFISIVLFALASSSAWLVLAYIVAIIVIVIFLVRFALMRIKKTRTKQSIFSDASQNGYVASQFDASLIGKTGVVLTDLKPGGHILIEGKKVQALSQAGYLVKGTEVRVVGGQEESLIVQPEVTK